MTENNLVSENFWPEHISFHFSPYLVLEVVFMAVIFEIGVTFSLIGWRYLGVLIYPFWWLLFFFGSSGWRWWLGFLLSLLSDYLLGFPLGLSWLIVNLLVLGVQYFVSWWWRLNRVYRLVFILLAAVIIVRGSYFFLTYSLKGFLITSGELMVLLSYLFRKYGKLPE